VAGDCRPCVTRALYTRVAFNSGHVPESRCILQAHGIALLLSILSAVYPLSVYSISICRVNVLIYSCRPSDKRADPLIAQMQRSTRGGAHKPVGYKACFDIVIRIASVSSVFHVIAFRSNGTDGVIDERSGGSKVTSVIDVAIQTFVTGGGGKCTQPPPPWY
jgi:hypothetical protein